MQTLTYTGGAMLSPQHRNFCSDREGNPPTLEQITAAAEQEARRIVEKHERHVHRLGVSTPTEQFSLSSLCRTREPHRVCVLHDDVKATITAALTRFLDETL